MSSYRDQTTWKREFREMRDAEAREAREREEQERAERERPLKEAEAALNASAIELAKITRQKLLTGVDDEGYLDPATRGMQMSVAEGTAYNAREIEAFREENDVHWSQRNVDVIGDYFSRNGVQLVSRNTLKAAWDRLSQYGLLEAPAPEPQPTAEPTFRPVPQEISEPQPETFEGWDPDSGERRKYSKWDVDKMSSEEYRRVFRIYREALRLPTRPAF